MITSMFLFLMLTFINSVQEPSQNYKTILVDKKVKDFQDSYDLNTPLDSCVSFNYLLINGKNSKLRSTSSDRIKAYLPDSNSKDSKVGQQTKDFYLNMHVKEVIIYKKFVACVISEYAESFFSIRYFSFENMNWVNAGEDLGHSMTESRQKFEHKAEMLFDYNLRIKTLSRISTNASELADYLKTHAKAPNEFVLDALKNHKVVIFGEVHKRKWSWELCKNLLKDPRFHQTVGVVFLEISEHAQDQLDVFLSNEELNKEVILDVLREVQSNGWCDRGMYEFIVEVWRLNKRLPSEKMVKIIAVDIPRPFNRFQSQEEQKTFFEKSPDRNENMSRVIEEHINSNKDKRNCLFIVGLGHAYKSNTPGFASSSSLGSASPAAGSLLLKKLSCEGVFSIFTHCPIIDNRGTIHGRLRKGLFDDSFHLNGDKPIAFHLKNSPFGREPFDALHEIGFRSCTGSYQNNYDGYIFLGPLDSEPSQYILYDLYSEDFIRELNRRAKLEKTSLKSWFGINESTKDAVISNLKKEYEGKMRWIDL